MARKERRLRLRWRQEVSEEKAFMNPETMKELDIEAEIEVVIAGKKRLRFKAFPKEDVPRNEVWCNEEELREHGIADKTIATVRAAG